MLILEYLYKKPTPFKTFYIIKVSNWFIDKIENFQIRAYAGCESSSSAKKFPQKDWKKKIIFCQIGVRDFQCVFLIKLQIDEKIWLYRKLLNEQCLFR